jgi:sucrose phosphorylase
MQMNRWQDYLSEELLKDIFPDTFELLGERLFELIQPYLTKVKRLSKTYDEHEVILITYGDSIYTDHDKPLKTLKYFAQDHLKGFISAIHLLPIYPFTSDDGFSVVDYLKIDEKLGDWKDIDAISQDFDLMLDAVINHISKESQWFKNYQQGIKPYTQFFTEKEDDFDVSQVIRPRALPLFHTYETVNGPKELWTTFSEDQIDINYASVDLIVEIAKVLLSYGDHGAKYIRLDAIGFACKASGTTCMHLKQTHNLIKLYRQMFDLCFGDVKLITETNVPHSDNISYFGNGYDEAHMVYQFPLPPLTLYSFIREDVTKMMKWLASIQPPSDQTTFFNFLASHDGIGMRPTEGVLSEEEKELMVNQTLNNGGRIGYKYNPDGTKSAYELNINYMDALKIDGMTEAEHIDKFIASQSILLALQGVPGIYIHSLLGSSNDEEGVEASGINRRINREKLQLRELEDQLNTLSRRSQVLNRFKRLLEIRKQQTAFSPMSIQKIVDSEPELFTIIRGQENPVLVVVNVSKREILSEKLSVNNGADLITGEVFDGARKIKPYEVLWIKI